MACITRALIFGTTCAGCAEAKAGQRHRQPSVHTIGSRPSLRSGSQTAAVHASSPCTSWGASRRRAGYRAVHPRASVPSGARCRSVEERLRNATPRPCQVRAPSAAYSLRLLLARRPSCSPACFKKWGLATPFHHHWVPHRHGSGWGPRYPWQTPHLPSTLLQSPASNKCTKPFQQTQMHHFSLQIEHSDERTHVRTHTH